MTFESIGTSVRRMKKNTELSITYSLHGKTIPNRFELKVMPD